MEMFFSTLMNAAVMIGDPWMMLLIFLGILWGCAAGATPGLTSVMAIAIMVPFTISMEPTMAIAFLVAINVGVAFGNSIPAILVGVPGTPSAVLTAIDGFALHKQGKSGLALGVT